MRHFPAKSAIALAALVAAVATAGSHGVKTKAIAVDHPWTHETKAAGDVAVYMKIKSLLRRDDRLTGASSEIARAVELHEAVPGGGSSIVSAITIKGAAAVELTPSGSRIVLKDVARALDPYDTFRLTLHFERAGRIDVEVLVEEIVMVMPPKH